MASNLTSAVLRIAKPLREDGQDYVNVVLLESLVLPRIRVTGGRIALPEIAYFKRTVQNGACFPTPQRAPALKFVGSTAKAEFEQLVLAQVRELVARLRGETPPGSLDAMWD